MYIIWYTLSYSDGASAFNVGILRRFYIVHRKFCSLDINESKFKKSYFRYLTYQRSSNKKKNISKLTDV